MIVPLTEITGLETVLDLLFDEAFSSNCGRQAAIDRLTEYFLVLFIRHVMTLKLVDIGIFAGLSDVRLSKAITAMHAQPEYPWTLEILAQTANMSRTRFAVNF